MEICGIEKCTGCFACMNICPKNAISCGEDKLGKTIPAIDENKCINCGLCKKVCPQNNPFSKMKPQKCYALWTNNLDDKKMSSSGGVQSGFSRYIIENGGVVFGAAFDKNMNLLHMSAETTEEALKFRGSKYVSSYTGMTFREAREYLDKGKLVLYVGTPCQIDGLKNYLRKDYENLITVDLICHGTPPIKYLKEYAQEVCGELPDKASFRGQYDFEMVFYKNDDITYRKMSGADCYFTAFLQGLTYRDNCYECPYARIERCSDITIGDFWEIDRSTLKNKYRGRISAALINTARGADFFDKVKERFVFEEREIGEAVRGNGNLSFPSRAHTDRDWFVDNYKKYGFCKAVKTPGIIKSVNKYRLKNNIVFRSMYRVKCIIYEIKERLKRGLV